MTYETTYVGCSTSNPEDLKFIREAQKREVSLFVKTVHYYSKISFKALRHLPQISLNESDKPEAFLQEDEKIKTITDRVFPPYAVMLGMLLRARSYKQSLPIIGR